MALLEFRNLPICGLDVAPVELLMNRKTRSILPCKETLYYPQVIQNMVMNIDNKNHITIFRQSALLEMQK